MMKNSNKLIVLTVLIILGSITAYNFKLKAMFDNRSYKNRFAGMKFTPFSGVSKLNLNVKYATNVEIEQGEKEGIWIHESLSPVVAMAVNDDALELKLNESEQLKYQVSVIIATRKLTDVTLKYDDLTMGGPYDQGDVRVKNFKSERLNLRQSGKVRVYLDKVELDTLNALVGDSTADHTTLSVSGVAKINTANYKIGVYGSLSMHGTRAYSVKRVGTYE